MVHSMWQVSLFSISGMQDCQGCAESVSVAFLRIVTAAPAYAHVKFATASILAFLPQTPIAKQMLC
jgi:hypothetical protein